MPYVLLSYDLVTPPGGQDEFKRHLQQLGWAYDQYGGTLLGGPPVPLPASTCYKNFPGVTDAAAIDQTKKDMVAARAKVRIDRFRVERWAMAACSTPSSLVIDDVL
jgi:hypothetical protein